jgi:hypothetical protein
MSLSFQPLQPICVRDPRTIVADQKFYGVLKSGSQMTNKQYSTTSISTSSLQFSCPPPSGGIFIDRNVRLYVPVRLTFTGTPPVGQTLLRSGFDAPRAFGLSSSIETLMATINNQSVSINLADVIQPLMWFNTGDELKNADYSTTPCYQDQSQSYDTLVGTNRNPLADYSVSVDNTPTPRGAFPFVVVSNPVSAGVPVTAVVDVAFNESLYLSPFWWGKGISSEAFFNVTTMDFNVTFLQQAANRFWSHASALGGVPFTTAAYTFGGLAGGPTSFGLTTGNSPFIFFTYITPQETQVLGPNMALTYPYFDVQRYATTQALVNPGATATMISNNIQLNSIPRRMYIFVRKQNQDLFSSATSTDTFFSIETLTIQFMNKNGLLASANKQQLYEMSVKNHCTMSWNQWSGTSPPIGNFTGAPIGTVGSIVCIEFGTDIGLDSLDAPGKLVQAMLQVQLNATNVSTAAITPELYIITVLEGVFSIKGLGRSSTSIGVITSKDILDCQSGPQLNYKDVQEVNGGDFFSTIKEGLSALGNRILKGITEGRLLSRIGDLATAVPGPIGSIASVASPILKTIGLGEGVMTRGQMHGYGEGVQSSYGYGEGEGEGVFAGRRHAARHRRRGRLAGGEEISREELADRILY